MTSNALFYDWLIVVHMKLGSYFATPTLHWDKFTKQSTLSWFGTYTFVMLSFIKMMQRY